jgi:predicted nucleic acid-binding Zn ribbon protein
LLSAIYLQFYLLVTDNKPMRHCENPACGMPIPITRKDKRFCNASCRSNARHYRSP